MTTLTLLWIAATCTVILIVSDVMAWGGSGSRILNNLVTELHQSDIGSNQGSKEINLFNSREGWVIFCVDTDGAGGGGINLRLKGSSTGITMVRGVTGDGSTYEAMRYLPAGMHTARIQTIGSMRMKSLSVRAIPELLFAGYPGDPNIEEFGTYDWEYLDAIGLLDNVNVIVSATEGEHIASWRGRGKRLIQTSGLPGRGDQSMTIEQMAAHWANQPGMVQPEFNGIIVDEFDERVADQFVTFAKAITQVTQLRSGRDFYPYVHGDPALLTKFIRPLMASGCRFAYLRYLKEQPTLNQAKAEIDRQLVQELVALEAVVPEVTKRLIVVLGLLSAPPLTLNANPGASYKVFMDMQMHSLATSSAARGLYGIEQWISSYADEDYLRWAAKLFRHYCIEGSTQRLTDDPYMLDHIQNPEFEQGLAGWTVRAAEPTSIEARKLDGLGWLQGRWPRGEQGDTFLWLRRSAYQANRVSQTIQNLEPGRNYSVKVLFADHGNLSKPHSNAITVEVEGVEAIANGSFQTVVKKRPSHQNKRFNLEDGYFGFQRFLFQAHSRTALLTLSDWVSPQESGGEAGQELMVNFIEVEPYLANNLGFRTDPIHAR